MKAKRVTAEGFVSNVYEQKFNLPEDVDTEKLTSVLHLALLFLHLIAGLTRGCPGTGS